MNEHDFVRWLDRRFPNYRIEPWLHHSGLYLGKQVTIGFVHAYNNYLKSQGATCHIWIRIHLTGKYIRYHGKCYEYIRDTINQLEPA